VEFLGGQECICLLERSHGVGSLLGDQTFGSGGHYSRVNENENHCQSEDLSQLPLSNNITLRNYSETRMEEEDG
jgi:hypothetical protein